MNTTVVIWRPTVITNSVRYIYCIFHIQTMKPFIPGSTWNNLQTHSRPLAMSLLCALPFQPPVTPVFSIISPFFICSHSMSLLFIQSVVVALCLPRVLVPSILPSKTVHRMDSLLNTWPNQFFCLCRMVFIKLLFSSTMSKTSWLDRCSVQLIFINLLQIHNAQCHPSLKRLTGHNQRLEN